jgi:hypothetical protein
VAPNVTVIDEDINGAANKMIFVKSFFTKAGLANIESTAIGGG